jgi:hypothetical protein
MAKSKVRKIRKSKHAPLGPAFEKKMKKAEGIIARYRNTVRALSN